MNQPTTRTTNYGEPNLTLARRLNVVAWILTVVVLGLVGAMRQIKISLP